MDIHFIAHAPYIDNVENLSSKELLHALDWALPRRLDTIDRIDDVPDSTDPSDLYGMAENAERSDPGHNGMFVPIGDIKFVRKWLSRTSNAVDPNMTPLEIPKSLRKYAKRDWRICLGEELTEEELNGKRFFIKDADELKHWNSSLHEGNLSEFIEPKTKYAISARVNFLSEWRTFVHDGQIVGCENYLGDPVMFPSRDTLYDMVRDYESSGSAPRAYTLDVGILSLEGDIDSDEHGHVTVPIEVHPFVACGLYGFTDATELPDMLVKGYLWYASEYKK